MTSSNLFNDFFPSSLEVDKRQFFKIRVLKICDQLFSSGQLTEKQKDDVSHLLRSIPKDLRNEGDAERGLKIPLTMGEAPICHLINWMPKKGDKEISPLKAFVFIAAICWQDEQDLDGTETTIADACRVVRQSEDGTGREVLQLLNFSGGFERLCHSIEQQKGKLNKESNQALKTKATEIKTSKHAYNYYLWSGEDEAVAAILTNRSPTNCTQLYYSSFDEAKLNTPFRTYLQKFFSYALPNEWLYELIVFSGPTGTHIRPKKEEIAKLLSILYLAMEKHHNYQSFHNALIVYMWIVMALYTSHRPVNSPFDLFSDLANESAFIWMCDKFSKKELTFRLVPKSKWIKRNIKRYSDHLKYIKIQCQSNKAVAAYIDEANENKAPFFFAFRDGKPIGVSPKWLAEQLDEIWPFPLNFPRHVSRGTLQTRKVLPEQMDAFMGHGTVGKDPLGQYSGFSLSDLSNITREIEDSLEELKIKDIPVWRVK
ncbi:hypothetical protein [Terasakiella pusilla]|uniref:hypothetical protein n=1 Tax=Terasakiella pusilla TaxID=64973 RepID=UPI003AA9B9A5